MNRLTCFWLAVFFRLAGASPRLTYALRPVLVGLAFSFSPSVRRNTAANAEFLIAEPLARRRFGHAVLGSFFDFVYDIGRNARLDRAALAGRVGSVEGADFYRAARAGGRGAVLVTAHMGSFEVGLAALPVDEPAVHVVFKRDRIAGFEDLRRQLRRRLAVVEAAVDDGFSTWVRLRDALQRDEVVAVQGDRVMPGQKGRRARVLGGILMLPTGPFKLALAANSPVIPIFTVRRSDGKVDIRIESSIEVTDVDAAVACFARSLSAMLARYPDQWLALHAAFENEQAVADPS